MKTYELVFIDADDTLFDYRKAEKEALSGAFQSHDISINDEIIKSYGSINKELWRKYEKNEITQEALRTERFRLLFNDLSLTIDHASFSEIYLDFLSNSAVLMENADTICRYLHENYTTVIITNGISKVQRNRFDKSPIRDCFDYLVISEEAGCNKPHIGIFEYAEQITGFSDREKMIIVGDSLTSDIAGGINYGIDTCWLNLHGTDNTKGIQPTYSVSNLLELRNIL
ncbi:noncanonical pyrimidine nucleotidase, YjjG family [Marispirochaeta aestuarii]|uniref:Noncanonical pyrimidine nucleotidase, YjjG family n=1 Tax=Marispirochaeta aestuarii TaxID=1963862 RepID=A0A1Y1RU14_9SPIO|nr:YjjG family noncanonical pyrimidine nucleotidase [Marispirochaeta aestuarii]ORC29896.1 noncanonical pyrimidine nucleotidase, YjjG family [Marispirochaeta aestuarii]